MSTKFLLFLSFISLHAGEPITDYWCSHQNNDYSYSYDERFSLMQEDMLLKVITLYTIEKYLNPYLYEFIENDPTHAITTPEQKILISSLCNSLNTVFLSELIENRHCLAYAYRTYYPDIAIINEHFTSQEEALGALLAKCFEIVLRESSNIDHAYFWINRILKSNPYLDYQLDKEDIDAFFQNPPIRACAQDTWQTMWAEFSKKE